MTQFTEESAKEGAEFLQERLDAITSQEEELARQKGLLQRAKDILDPPKKKVVVQARPKKTKAKKKAAPKVTRDEARLKVMQELIAGRNQTPAQIQKATKLSIGMVRGLINELVQDEVIELYRTGYSGHQKTGKQAAHYRLRSADRTIIHLGMTQTSLTRDEARAVEGGERRIAGQT